MSLRAEILADVKEMFDVDLDDIPRDIVFRQRNDDTYTPGGAVALEFTDYNVKGVIDRPRQRQRETDSVLETEFVVYIEAADLGFRPKQDDRVVLPVNDEYRVIDADTDPVEAVYVLRLRR